MKTSIAKIIFFVIIFPALSFAQNWQPVHLNWKYNYKTDSASIITNTIWIDSSEVINGDSVFYLNRIVTHCDTCHASLGGPNPCDSCYALSNQPQFLQRQVTKFANGIFYFNDTSKLVINSLAALNDSWLFDSVANISAQVISVATDSVFGTIDSVKAILLTNGDTLKLSMNYGILKFPHLYSLNSYFNLVGIEGLNVGEKVPGFWEIFDFNVGDVFHFTGSNTDLSFWPNGLVTYYQRQYTIQNKISISDTVYYYISGWYWGYTLQFPAIINYFSNPTSASFYIYDSTFDFSDTYNKQLIYPSRIFHNYPFAISGDSLIDLVVFENDSNGIFSKSYGNQNYNYNNYLSIDSINHIFNHIDPQSAAWLGTTTLKYKVGLGQTDYSYGFFEHGGEEHLVGYIKNGNTVGLITAYPQLENENQFSIYPNPAKEKISIHLAATSIGKVFITDNTGRNISEKDFNGTEIEINVSSISSGLYFLSVKTEKGLFTKKIIVSGNNN